MFTSPENDMDRITENDIIAQQLVKELLFQSKPSPSLVKMGRERTIVQLKTLKELERRLLSYRANHVGTARITNEIHTFKSFLSNLSAYCPATTDCSSCDMVATRAREIATPEELENLPAIPSCALRYLTFTGTLIHKNTMLLKVSFAIHIMEHIARSNGWDRPPGRKELAKKKRELRAKKLAKQLPKSSAIGPKPKPKPKKTAGAAYKTINFTTNNTNYYGWRTR